MKMIPIILETDDRFRKVIAQIEDFISMIWTERYFTPGDFEICVPATSRNLSILKKGYFVGRVTDRGLDSCYGVIEYLEKSIDEEGRKQIIARGRFLGAFLYRRVIWKQTSYSNKTLKQIITGLLEDNATDASQNRRNYLGMDIYSASIDGPTIANIQFTGQNLGEQISEICERYGIGWKMREAATPTLELYSGIDRSVGQSTNKWAIFSDDDGSLLTLNYSENDENKVNAVRIAGEGEGSAREIIWTEKSPATSGYDRYELFVDARDLSSNNGEISASAYAEMLGQRAEENFTDTEYILEATASFNRLQYKADVDLGDVCTIKSKALGIEVDARLVEVIESIDEEGRYSAVPTFSI